MSGAEWLKRQEGQPGTLFGWQGIVPAKVKKMGGNFIFPDNRLLFEDKGRIWDKSRKEKDHLSKSQWLFYISSLDLYYKGSDDTLPF